MKQILAGNWKLYKTRPEVVQFFEATSQLEVPANVECFVAPSPPLLETAVRESAKNGNKIKVLSQNVCFKPEGALTGEIGINQIKELGVAGSIVEYGPGR